MAIGLADDDYRAKYGVMPGTNQSEFGQWIDGNRQAVYNEAQGWFTYVPPTGGTGTGTGTGGNGTIACTMIGKKPLAGSVCCAGLKLDAGGICNTISDETGDEIFGIPKEYLIYGAIGIVALMLMNK
jgi:hypothetical protein